MEIFEGKKIEKDLDSFIFLMENQKFSENFKINGLEEDIQKEIDKSNFKGKEGEFKVIYIEKMKKNFFLIGFGLSSKLTFESFKSILFNTLSKSSNVFYIFFNPEILRIDENSFFVSSLYLSTIDYKFQEFLSEKVKEKKCFIFKPFNIKEKEFKEILEKVKAIKEGIFLAKEIGNMPASSISINYFLEKIKKFSKKFNWRVNVYDEKKLKILKLPGIINVGKSSEKKPVLIEIFTSNKKEKILIGKGVIFDSGGLSIKTAEGMENMKYDKCGAGVVLGALLSLSILKKNDGVAVYIPLVENLLSEKSYKPGDILKYPNGETVEVISTDAEGRLILADSLIFSSKNNPSFIISVATLTGAMKFSLGPYAAGLFTKDKNLENSLILSSNKTGEFLWPFPLWEEYEALIKGEHSTLKNTSQGIAGSIAGALFLNHFTQFPFAHIDIAQVAYKTEKKQKGATGFGVSLLVDFISNGNYRK